MQRADLSPCNAGVTKIEVDPMVCPKCGGQMRVIAFITDFQAVDCIIDHLKLTFVAEKLPPSRVLTEVALMAAEERAEYLSYL